MDANSVRVESFLLCRALELHNNEFFMLGGGWNTVGFYSFPGVLLPFSIAVRLMVPIVETNQVLEFRVTMEDSDGNDILPRPLNPQVTVGRPGSLVPGEEHAVHSPLEFEGVDVPRAGTYTFALFYQETALARTEFSAVSLSLGTQLDR